MRVGIRIVAAQGETIRDLELGREVDALRNGLARVDGNAHRPVDGRALDLKIVPVDVIPAQGKVEALVEQRAANTQFRVAGLVRGVGHFVGHGADVLAGRKRQHARRHAVHVAGAIAGAVGKVGHQVRAELVRGVGLPHHTVVAGRAAADTARIEHDQRIGRATLATGQQRRVGAAFGKGVVRIVADAAGDLPGLGDVERAFAVDRLFLHAGVDERHVFQIVGTVDTGPVRIAGHIFAILRAIAHVVVEAAEHPAERPAMGRDQAQFLVELVILDRRAVVRRELGEGFIAIVEVEQEVGVVALGVVGLRGEGSGRNQLRHVAKVGEDFGRIEVRLAAGGFQIAPRRLVAASAHHARAIGLRAAGLGDLVRPGEVGLEVGIYLKQQLVARGEGVFVVHVLLGIEIGGLLGGRAERSALARGAATGLRVGHARLAQQVVVVDKAWIVIITHRAAQRDVVLEDRDVHRAIGIHPRRTAVRFPEPAPVEIDRIVLGIGTAGHVAHRTGQRAEAIEGALRPLKNFDVINVEQLEVDVERHFTKVDTHRRVGIGTIHRRIARIDAAQNDVAARPRPGVDHRHARREGGQPLDVVDALAGQFGRTDRADVDRRVHQGGGTAGGRHDDGVALPARIGGARVGSASIGSGLGQSRDGSAAHHHGRAIECGTESSFGHVSPRLARKASCRRHPLCFHTGPPSRARAGSLRTSPVNCIPVRRHVCALCPKGQQPPFDLPFDTWTRPAPSSQEQISREKGASTRLQKCITHCSHHRYCVKLYFVPPEIPRLATGHLRRIPHSCFGVALNIDTHHGTDIT